MPLYLKIVSLLFGLFFLMVFFNLVKKKSVKPFYTTLWLLVSLFMLSVVIFESFYKGIATKLGLTDASFLIIVALISFLLVYVLYLSIKISEMSDRIQELISHASILEHEIRKTKSNEDN
ncbi:MAG: DUF2304 domain-containing protein [bacterium]